MSPSWIRSDGARRLANRSDGTRTSPPARTNVTLRRTNVTFSWSPGCWPSPSRPTVRGAGSNGDPPVTARSSSHHPAFTLTPLALLTAGAGVGDRHSPIDVGPSRAITPYPPSIEKEELPTVGALPQWNSVSRASASSGAPLCPHSSLRGTVQGRTSSSFDTHDGSGRSHRPGIERGAQAGIEPATGASVTEHIGSARAVRIMSTHLHSECATPRIRSDAYLLAAPVPRCDQMLSPEVTLRVTAAPNTPTLNTIARGVPCRSEGSVWPGCG
jgi:hypothetical protein